ncbi:MAG: endolytic transglycosylase MltG [Minisyncoccia bacterium]
MYNKFKNFILERVRQVKLFLSNMGFSVDISQKRAFSAFVLAFALVILYIYFHSPPKNFPIGQVFTVSSGESLEEVTNNLYEIHAIKFPVVFRNYVIIQGGEKKVMAGDYLLDSKEGPFDLAYRLVNGKFHLDIARVTIPEGWNIFEISEYLEKTLLNFDDKKFLSLAKSKEGYLFPDTYFVSPAVNPEDLIEKMAKNFNKKILDIPGLSTTTYKFSDVIIMASIVEREARTTDSRRTVAGILWRRLKIGMPLQVDAAFNYVNGKSTFDLTKDDLKIDSPYNTYKYKGLPPGPIGNPGANSIMATINPIVTKYLYFLTGKDGKMYYAVTFEQHVKNKQKYLY